MEPEPRTASAPVQSPSSGYMLTPRRILVSLSGMGKSVTHYFSSEISLRLYNYTNLYLSDVDNNLVTTVTSMYLAGTDTTAESLYWAFLYMVLYPEVQEKIHQEIQQQLGK